MNKNNPNRSILLILIFSYLILMFLPMYSHTERIYVTLKPYEFDFSDPLVNERVFYLYKHVTKQTTVKTNETHTITKNYPIGILIITFSIFFLFLGLKEHKYLYLSALSLMFIPIFYLFFHGEIISESLSIPAYFSKSYGKSGLLIGSYFSILLSVFVFILAYRNRRESSGKHKK